MADVPIHIDEDLDALLTRLSQAYGGSRTDTLRRALAALEKQQIPAPDTARQSSGQCFREVFQRHKPALDAERGQPRQGDARDAKKILPDLIRQKSDTDRCAKRHDQDRS